jgi:CRISPR system Cascade subunit CasC
VHELRRQLGGDPEDTAKAVREFTRAFIVSMPTGKQNTFANRTLPSSVFVSVRGDQPINLVTAFESPLFSNGKSEGYAVESAKRLAKHELEIRNTFAPAPIITWQVGIGLEDLGQPVNLQTALDGLEKCIRES